MKLKNKKTGEVIDLDIANIKAQFGGISVIPEPVKLGGDEYVYHSLAELNEEWEDYEEPEEYWWIDPSSMYMVRKILSTKGNIDKEIGNYFGTEEEAERAVEKLKAWKRLKDKGFRFKTWGWEKHSGKEFTIWFTIEDFESSAKDLNLLFGGGNE